MPIPKQVHKTLGALIVLASLAAPLAAKPGDAIPPTTIVFTSTDRSEILTQGRTFTYTTADSTFSLLSPGVFLFLAKGGDQNVAADVRFDVRDVGRYRGDFVKGRAYEGTIAAAVQGEPAGPYLAASIEGRSCNDEKNTTGRFEVIDYQWQKVYYPKGTKLSATDTVGIPEDRLVSFAVTRFQASFELRCNGASSTMTGSVDFYGEKGPVPQFAVEFIGPVEPCFDPALVTSANPGCAGVPGSGTIPGGDTGGATFPTLPPPPPPPDVKLVLPPALVDVPALLLTNSSSTSFKFTTTPASGISSDVSLSIETDAKDGDGFSASITPDFIAAPGAGEATVTISVGPNTFPRDYRVTVTATANGKTSSSTFIVTVQCDPPMILGIDQPQNQRVNPGSTANVSVKATGSGPFSYQWYSGRRGNTRTPIAGATSATFTTPGVTGAGSYWVRVSNPCGTVDSNSVSVSPR